MTEKYEETPQERKKVANPHLAGFIAWLVAIVLCAGIVIFAFWQVGVAQSMQKYQAVRSYETPEVHEEIVAAMPPFEPQAVDAGFFRKPLTETDLNTEYRTEPIEYTVSSGDSVWGISERYGVSVESILCQLQNFAG